MRPKEEEEQGPQLLFITQTGPKRSRGSSTQVKKFVMKDIGRARRKPNKKATFEIFIEGAEDPNQAARLSQLTPDLETGTGPDVLEGEASALVGFKQPWEGVQPSQPADAAASLHISNQASQSLPLLQPQSQELMQATPQIERVWTGRLDPFYRYPIEMDHRSFQLLDHCRSTPPS